MKHIKLSKGVLVTIDDEDYEKLNKYNWYFGARDRVMRSGGIINGKRIKIYIHREIMNCLPKYVVDHIDGNPLNNQKSNLRICESAENSRNQKIRKDNKSGYKGVSIKHYPNKDVWVARITKYGRVRFLGEYPTAHEASHAYNKAAKKIHGEFARLNECICLADKRTTASQEVF